MSSRNPWRDLPAKPPYVLRDDQPYVCAFNRDLIAKSDRTTIAKFRIVTSALPEPFLGRFDAPVVLLALNPGSNPRDAAWHRRPDFRRRWWRYHATGGGSHPFYHLDPEEEGPGARWWRPRARALRTIIGESALSRNLLCVEFFPYHSKRFGHSRLRLPSQGFGFQLVRHTVGRGAVIIQLRGARLWEGAVPELCGYRRRYFPATPMSAFLSERNCGPGFRAMVKAIRAAREARS